MNSKYLKILVAISLPLVLAAYFIFLSQTVNNQLQSFALNIISTQYRVSKEYMTPASATAKQVSDKQISLDISSHPKYIRGDRSAVQSTDVRVIALHNFLLDYSSPMYPYADVFVEEADKYDADWRLVVAISGVESAFGRLIPPGSYNAWGWKGDPTQAWSHFRDWPDGIETVTRRMALGYGTDLTPFQIEPVYCPPCGQNPAHAWANGVTNFMNILNVYVEEVESK